MIFSRRPLSSRPSPIAIVSVVLLATALAAGSARAQPRSPSIKEVRLTQQGSVSLVTIEATGPLPVPQMGQLDSPPRVFFDFHGVGAATTGARGEAGAPVVRVRVALYSQSPRVTRVVLDLARVQPVRTEAEELEGGRFRVLIGVGADDARPVSVPLADPDVPPPSTTPARPPTKPDPSAPQPIAPVAPLPPPPTAPQPGTAAPAAAPSPPPAAMSPGRPPSPPLPAREIERYSGQVGDPLARFRRLRPLLSAIDTQDPRPPDGLPEAREELAAILRTLTAVRPSDQLRATHDLLVRSASFALMAVTLRVDAGTRAEPEKMRNASSAAAGALVLLGRVCADISCDAAPVKDSLR